MWMSSAEEKYNKVLVFRGGGICKCNQNYGGVLDDVHQIVSIIFVLTPYTLVAA